MFETGVQNEFSLVNQTPYFPLGRESHALLIENQPTFQTHAYSMQPKYARISSPVVIVFDVFYAKTKWHRQNIFIPSHKVLNGVGQTFIGHSPLLSLSLLNVVSAIVQTFSVVCWTHTQSLSVYLNIILIVVHAVFAIEKCVQSEFADSIAGKSYFNLRIRRIN